MYRFSLSTVVCVVFATALQAHGEPGIEITSVPAYGFLGSLHGKVTGVDHPENYEVAAYIQPEGVGWWTKPTFASLTVPVDPNGAFQVDVTTGGASSSDPRATLYCVNLVQAGTIPQSASGLCYQPEPPLFLATATHERYVRTMEFSGRMWGVKESPIAVGPGPNRFSQDPTDVWVDPDSKLHFTIHQRDSNWYSTEVILTESLGYGRYLVQTSSRVDLLDSRAIFGAFLWDAFGEPGLPDGRCNREIDFEDAVWSYPPRPLENTQFVVQPWDTPGNRHQFQLPDLSDDAKLTRILTWEEDRLHFLLLRGHQEFADYYPPSDIIEEWDYVEDPKLNHWVPDPGRERFRFNLYLRGGVAPVGDGALEVVVDKFAYVPEPTTLALAMAGLLSAISSKRCARRPCRPIVPARTFANTS